MDTNPIRDKNVVFFFFLIPTIMLIVGYFVFLNNPFLLDSKIIYIPLFLGIVLLGIGFFLNKVQARKIKMAGWGSFSFFWAIQPGYLYAPSSDMFNAVVCIIGVYVLIYIAYHEWLSIKRNEQVSCLNWIAGGTFLAGIIYFTIDSGILPELKNGLINIVASQSAAVLNLLNMQAIRNGCLITYKGISITIIFACTAIQSMVLFVGMNGAIGKVSLKRRATAIAATVVPIYFLNLIRNALVIFLVGENITSFNMAHNVIAKSLSLIALIILLFLNFKIVPELSDEILCIFNLTKRKGPVENFFTRLMGKK